MAENDKHREKLSKEDKRSRKIPLKKYSYGGRVSSVIALCALVVLIATVSISILQKGKSGIYVGILVLIVFVAAVVGFVIGIRSFKEENKFLRFTYMGTIANAAIGMCILGMYMIYV